VGILRRTKSIIEQTETEIAGLRQRRDVLSAKLSETGLGIEQAIADRRARLVEGNPDDQAAPDHVAVARDRRDALTDALDIVDRQIAEAATRLDAARDRARREVAARELNGVTDELTKVADELAGVIAKVPAALGAVLDRLPQAVVSKSHTEMFANEVVAALRMVVSESRSYAAQIVSGAAQICEPSPQPVNPPTSAVERLEIFPLQASKWVEADGSVVTTGRHTTISPPAPIARAALANGTALDPLSDNAIVLRQRIPPDYSCYLEQDCIDLASPKLDKPVDKQTAAPAVFHSEFTRPRGGFATVGRNPR
jgi:hypothetical protein